MGGCLPQFAPCFCSLVYYVAHENMNTVKVGAGPELQAFGSCCVETWCEQIAADWLPIHRTMVHPTAPGLAFRPHRDQARCLRGSQGPPLPPPHAGLRVLSALVSWKAVWDPPL